MQAISVTQLNGYIKNIFDNEELLHNISVVGEVFGVSFTRNVVYFSLKDENSTMPCVCFYPAYADKIKEGELVTITGSPNFYTKAGKLNFNVIKVETVGIGKLFEEFLKLKEKLEKEGLFDQLHKKPLPKEIKRIGVITSREGAVIQDIKNVAWRRDQSVDIVLYNTKVQGNGADKEIAMAIEKMSNYKDIDVIVVARGGGSMEDLSAYNSEIIARATYNCIKPIVSAVGHETDFTIIDFVSDLRAPTPSAAAEILTIDIKEKKENTLALIENFNRSMIIYLNDHLYNWQNNTVSLVNKFEKMLLKENTTLNNRLSRLSHSSENFLNEKIYQLGINENNIKRLDPRQILKQGYAKIEQKNKNINAKSDLSFEDNFSIIFSDGQIEAKPIKEE